MLRERSGQGTGQHQRTCVYEFFPSFGMRNLPSPLSLSLSPSCIKVLGGSKSAKKNSVHSFPSCAFLFHLLISISFTSSITAFSHVLLGLRLLLVRGFRFYIIHNVVSSLRLLILNNRFQFECHLTLKTRRLIPFGMTGFLDSYRFNQYHFPS